MIPQHCIFCQAPLAPYATGIAQCLNGHFILTNITITYTTATGTSTANTGYISFGNPEPARTIVPNAFYRAFAKEDREREQRYQAKLDALADIANMEQEDGMYD
jgi:hypothetical protein